MIASFARSQTYKSNISLEDLGKEKEDLTVFDVFVEALREFFSNIYVLTLSIYGLWILIGILWYHYYMKWTVPTAFFYTIEAGLSIGFCNPAEKDDNTRSFTIIYVLVGSSVVSGVLGFCLSSLLSTQRKIVQTDHNADSMNIRDLDGNITYISLSRYLWYEVKYWFGWYTNRSMLISISIFVFWMALGTAYGMIYEEWTLITSLYWAITSCSTGGLQSPACLHGTDGTTCDVGSTRGVLMGLYLAIGVPIYAATVSQFALLGVGWAIDRQARHQLRRPIQEAEFLYAANILSEQGSTTLVLGEFIFLELIRLGRTDKHEIDQIKEKFVELDTYGVGILDMVQLKKTGAVVPNKLASFEKLAQRMRRSMSFNSDVEGPEEEVEMTAEQYLAKAALMAGPADRAKVTRRQSLQGGPTGLSVTEETSAAVHRLSTHSSDLISEPGRVRSPQRSSLPLPSPFPSPLRSDPSQTSGDDVIHASRLYSDYAVGDQLDISLDI